MNYKNVSDNALIQQISQKNQDALGEIYDRYGRLVFSVAFHIVGEQSKAEEITQEVFIRVWEKSETYDSSKAKLSTWLISITRYRAIDINRRAKVRVEKNSINWDDVPVEQTPKSNGIEKEYESNWRRQLVRDAINKLPYEQKAAISLAYFHGLTHREIAETLHEPLGTIKTRIRLGMQKLRDLLSELKVEDQ